jgi:hypothetical protein
MSASSSTYFLFRQKEWEQAKHSVLQGVGQHSGAKAFAPERKQPQKPSLDHDNTHVPRLLTVGKTKGQALNKL